MTIGIDYLRACSGGVNRGGDGGADLENLQVILAAGAVVLVLVLLRRALADISGRPRREEAMRRVREQADRDDRSDPGGHPCPVCGSPTRLHGYPHISVWRCSRYPDCRGFVKAKKPSRPAFAKKWERKRGHGDPVARNRLEP